MFLQSQCVVNYVGNKLFYEYFIEGNEISKVIVIMKYFLGMIRILLYIVQEINKYKNKVFVMFEMQLFFVNIFIMFCFVFVGFIIILMLNIVILFIQVLFLFCLICGEKSIYVGK